MGEIRYTKNMKTFLILFLFCALKVTSEASLSSFEHAVHDYMKTKEIPGVAIAICYEGKGFIISYGLANKNKLIPVTPDTLFALASITKVFTSTELALQLERGKIQLHDLLILHLPDMLNKNGAISKVTFLQLATHTSGLPRVPPSENSESRQEVLEFLETWTPKSSHYRYSNLGFGLIGYALETLTQKSYEQLLTRDIFRPLNMTSTVVNIPDNRRSLVAQGYSRNGKPVPFRESPNAWPAGGALYSSSFDMLKFLKANLGIGDTSSELLAAMQLAQKSYFKVNEKLEMGLGWQRVFLDGHLLIEKNGGVPGFSSYIGMVPAKKIGIVILTNKAKINSTRFGRLLIGEFL